MARPIPEGQLSGPPAEALTFSIADSRDDTEIRELLKRSPMPGKVTISLEREPDYFAEAKVSVGAQRTIVARYEGRIVCVGYCSVRRRFFNRQARRVGYLGGLRLAPEVAGRFDILRRGYSFFRDLSWPEPPEFHFSSIVKDNLRARQFLERNLSGMPRYRFMGDFVTVLIPVPKNAGGREIHQSIDDPEELAKWLNHNNANYQMAPYWTAAELLSLRALGLKLENFAVTREDGDLTTSAAIWDQRAFKQTVIQNYDPKLAFIRPALNQLFAFRGLPGLPAVGSTLSQGFISHLALHTEQPGLLAEVVRSLYPIARREGLEFLTAGLMEGDRRLTVLRRNFSGREYRSKIYFVSWGDTLYQPQGLLPSPEIALL